MICCLVSESARGDARLIEIARACSPRVEAHGDRVIVFDASGLERVIGTPADIAHAVDALAREHGIGVRVALASTRVAAWLLAHAARSTITVVTAAETRSTVAALPVTALSVLPGSTPRRRRSASGTQEQSIATLMRWGLRSLGEVAALPRADVQTRLGPEGCLLYTSPSPRDS